MSAILRLKRKRNEEPTDTIVLSRKRSKPGDDLNQREVFRLAGTTNDINQFNVSFTVTECNSLTVTSKLH